MSREETPLYQRSEAAYLIETPAERAVFGVMTIILGFLVMACITITMIGIGRSGEMSFFARMANTVRSLAPDYYDVRIDEMEHNDLGGKVRLSTNSDLRSVGMNIHIDGGRNYTIPGSHGSSTFYIVPNDADKPQKIHLRLNTYGIKQAGNGDFRSIEEMDGVPDAASVNDLLDGHILFFLERGDHYGEFIENGDLYYDTSEHEDDFENGEYKVTVYWIWTEYYEQLTDETAEGALFENDFQAKQMGRYINEHRSRFLYDRKSGETLSDKYNNGDQLIYENVDCIGFEIIALE